MCLATSDTLPCLHAYPAAPLRLPVHLGGLPADGRLGAEEAQAVQGDLRHGVHQAAQEGHRTLPLLSPVRSARAARQCPPAADDAAIMIKLF